MMEDVDDPMFPAVHPLYNSVVLTTLFRKLCPVEDLPKCRLVCKLWHDTSLDTFRSTHTLRLDYSKSFSSTTNEEGSIVSISNSLKQFHNLLEDPSAKCIETPHRKLHLTSWPFQLGPNGMFRDPWIERLCWGPILVPHITTLNLNRCHFAGSKEFQLIIYRFCPVLQKLTLCWNTCNEEQRWETMAYQEPEYGEQINLKSIDIEAQSPVSWLELLSHFPSLHSVGIRNLAYWDSKVIEVLEALKVVKMQDANKLPIHDFDVTPYISISGDGNSLRTCNILREFNIPIKRVNFKLDQGISRELVQSVIELHSNSLISINVNYSRTPGWSFPLGVPLKKLETLEIRSHSDPFTDMEFLKFIPSLVNLSLLSSSSAFLNPTPHHPFTQMVSNTLESHELVNLQLIKLKELKIDFTLGEEDMRRLAKWLPNIQKLEMVLDDAQFSIVCKNWTNLTNLVVHGNKLTDMGVIGRPADISEDGVGEIEVLPNVTCLDNLTCFYANDCDKITDASVLNGFLKMKTYKLNRLRLHTLTNRSKIALHRRGILIEPRNR